MRKSNFLQNKFCLNMSFDEKISESVDQRKKIVFEYNLFFAQLFAQRMRSQIAVMSDFLH